MRLDESLIYQYRKVIYVGMTIGLIAAVGAIVGGFLEHDWKLVLAAVPVIITSSFVIIYIKSLKRE